MHLGINYDPIKRYMGKKRSWNSTPCGAMAPHQSNLVMGVVIRRRVLYGRTPHQGLKRWAILSPTTIYRNRYLKLTQLSRIMGGKITWYISKFYGRSTLIGGCFLGAFAIPRAICFSVFDFVFCGISVGRSYLVGR